MSPTKSLCAVFHYRIRFTCNCHFAIVQPLFLLQSVKTIIFPLELRERGDVVRCRNGLSLFENVKKVNWIASSHILITKKVNRILKMLLWNVKKVNRIASMQLRTTRKVKEIAKMLLWNVKTVNGTASMQLRTTRKVKEIAKVFLWNVKKVNGITI